VGRAATIDAHQLDVKDTRPQHAAAGIKFAGEVVGSYAEGSRSEIGLLLHLGLLGIAVRWRRRQATGYSR